MIRINFAEFSRELLLHNYTLVSMDAVYTKSESSPRKIICKMLLLIACANTLAANICKQQLTPAVFAEHVFVMFQNQSSGRGVIAKGVLRQAIIYVLQMNLYTYVGSSSCCLDMF